MYVGWEGWRDGGLTAGPGILMRLPLQPPSPPPSSSLCVAACLASALHTLVRFPLSLLWFTAYSRFSICAHSAQ